MEPNYWDNPEYNIPDESEVNLYAKKTKNPNNHTAALRKTTENHNKTDSDNNQH